MRDAAQLNYLGSAGFSTLPDFAKIMMEHELGDVFKALFGILKDERVRMNAREGKLAGEILEIIAGDSHMRLVDEVTNNPFSQGFYQKNVSKLKWGFYLANLLGTNDQCNEKARCNSAQPYVDRHVCSCRWGWQTRSLLSLILST